MPIAYGLQPSAFKIADVGVKRTGGDVLRIEGFKNPEELAAASRILAMWKQDRLEEANQYENVRNSVIVEVANQCGERLAEAIEMVNRDKDKIADRGVPRSMLAAMYFAYYPSFPTRTEYFYNALVHPRQSNYPGVDWAEEHEVEGAQNPASMLEDRMTNNASYTRARKLGFLIKAMNYYCLQEPQKRLRYRKADHFPEVAADIPEEIRGEMSLDLECSGESRAR